MVSIHTCRENTHTYKIIIINFKSEKLVLGSWFRRLQNTVYSCPFPRILWMPLGEPRERQGRAQGQTLSFI